MCLTGVNKENLLLKDIQQRMENIYDVHWLDEQDKTFLLPLEIHIGTSRCSMTSKWKMINCSWLDVYFFFYSFIIGYEIQWERHFHWLIFLSLSDKCQERISLRTDDPSLSLPLSANYEMIRDWIHWKKIRLSIWSPWSVSLFLLIKISNQTEKEHIITSAYTCLNTSTRKKKKKVTTLQRSRVSDLLNDRSEFRPKCRSFVSYPVGRQYRTDFSLFGSIIYFGRDFFSCPMN